MSAWFLIFFVHLLILMLTIALGNVHVGIGSSKWFEDSHVQVRPLESPPQKSLFTAMSSLAPSDEFADVT